MSRSSSTPSAFWNTVGASRPISLVVVSTVQPLVAPRQLRSSDEHLVALLHLLRGEVGPGGLHLGEDVDDVGAGCAGADGLTVGRVLVGGVVAVQQIAFDRVALLLEAAAELAERIEQLQLRRPVVLVQRNRVGGSDRVAGNDRVATRGGRRRTGRGGRYIGHQRRQATGTDLLRGHHLHVVGAANDPGWRWCTACSGGQDHQQYSDATPASSEAGGNGHGA